MASLFVDKKFNDMVMDWLKTTVNAIETRHALTYTRSTTFFDMPEKKRISAEFVSEDTARTTLIINFSSFSWKQDEARPTAFTLLQFILYTTWKILSPIHSFFANTIKESIVENMKKKEYLMQQNAASGRLECTWMEMPSDAQLKITFTAYYPPLSCQICNKQINNLQSAVLRDE